MDFRLDFNYRQLYLKYFTKKSVNIVYNGEYFVFKCGYYL